MEDMGAGLPAWLTTLSWIYIAVALASAAAILYDIRRRKSPSSRRGMEAVWPLAALYLGPLAFPVYRRFGREAGSVREPDGISADEPATSSAVHSGLFGGVSSGLAHIVAVPFVVATGLTIANMDMWAMVVIIALLAAVSIFLFEYVSSASANRGVPGLIRVRSALVVAALTVAAFDLGMLSWMLILHYTENMPAAGDVRFTFLMQIGLILGTLTVYPAARWLVGRGRRAPAS
ncbi:DUF4396 domain-containing protein [Thermoleophilia bacterium SCSIO 60948]|nr:DUF4396 domain-containing protein [Thermoleophilia bacterium SCSIO 60948]